MSVLISILKETIIAGMVATLTDVIYVPSPNLNGSELVLYVILDFLMGGS